MKSIPIMIKTLFALVLIELVLDKLNIIQFTGGMLIANIIGCISGAFLAEFVWNSFVNKD